MQCSLHEAYVTCICSYTKTDSYKITTDLCLPLYMNFLYEFHHTQTTINVENTCDSGFVGTSAATPLASGIIALVLEAK